MTVNENLPPDDKIKLFDALISNFREVERKGKTMPYTSLNGHMFSFLSKEGVLALRLPKDEREKFINEHKTDLMVSHGAIMKEYVKVPGKLFSNTEALKPYLEKSYDYIRTLKPKPTKKKK